MSEFWLSFVSFIKHVQFFRLSLAGMQIPIAQSNIMFFGVVDASVKVFGSFTMLSHYFNIFIETLKYKRHSLSPLYSCLYIWDN